VSYRADDPPAEGTERAREVDPEAPATAPRSEEAQPTRPVEAADSARPVEPAESAATTSASAPAPNMLPGRERRRLGAERFLMRVIATAGIVGIGVAIAAIMQASNSQGWIIGLVVAIVSVVLSAILWSSRQL